MRKLLVSVALATATLAAVPAAAQHPVSHAGWNRHGPDRHAVHQLSRQLEHTDARITRSARNGVISRREALSLRREADRVRNRLYRAGRNGLSGREFAELRVQVNRLQQRVRIERRDNDGRRW